MRKTRQTLCCVLLVVLLVCSLCVPAMAVDAASLVSLSGPAAAKTGEAVEILVNAETANVIADGRLVISYDPAVLEFTGAEVGTQWPEGSSVTLSVNSETSGKVILAFASVYGAKVGDMFVLHFAAKAAGTSEVAVTGGYVSYQPNASLDANTTVTVEDEGQGDEIYVTFISGVHGRFEDGTLMDVRPLSAGDVIGWPPEVIVDAGWQLNGWRCTVDGLVYSEEEISRMTAEVSMGFVGVYEEDGAIPVPGDPNPPVISGSGACDGGANCPSRQFTDVNFSGDYHKGIDFMVANGYMNGTSATTFSPDMSMDRAMLVTILYRLAGEPAVSGENVFTDVFEGDYYYKAVLWAASKGITTGTSETTFSPKTQLTREQIATFLYRYAKFAGMSASARGDLSKYTDANTVSEYARTAMEWAVGSGIVNGVTDTTLMPRANATRVQIAVMVWRLMR